MTSRLTLNRVNWSGAETLLFFIIIYVCHKGGELSVTLVSKFDWKKSGDNEGQVHKTRICITESLWSVNVVRT